MKNLSLRHYTRQPIDENIKEMLRESNAIEGEYSSKALDNAIRAWTYAIKNCKNQTTNYIFKIHKLLAQGIRDDIAGQPRHCDVSIGGHKKIYVSDALIKDQLKNFISTETTLVEQAKGKTDEKKEGAAKASHLYFENIHPHEDFNGRVGRILYQITRLKLGLPIKIIHHGKEQAAYYQWFKE